MLDSESKEEEEIHADYLRYWFEEAQELDMTKDPKFETLNEINEKLDLIAKAFKVCSKG